MTAGASSDPAPTRGARRGVMTAGASSDPAPTRGARRRAQTRAQLLDAARTLFARQGVDATAIAEITEQADVGFGSFYNHFASKEEIVEVIVSDALEAQGRIVDALTSDLEDPAEIVAVAHRYFVRQTRSDPILGWLLVRLDASHRVMTQALGERARRDIARGIASGRFNVADPEVAFLDTAGALLLVMRAVLDGDAGPGADSSHAEGLLRILGLTPEDAAEVAHRPLAPAPHARPTKRPPDQSGARTEHRR
jgi:AcrR family transcriptional regulator